MSVETTIYVYVHNENVDVWCPVRAERLDGNAFLILEQLYDRETELWQFEPGDKVVCEVIELEGKLVLAAIKSR